MARNYWLDLFTGTTWEGFQSAGGEVSGFRERRWKTVQRIKPGDYLLCYLTGVSRWIGVLEVTSEPFRDDTPIWSDEEFPCRVRVRPLVTLRGSSCRSRGRSLNRCPAHSLLRSLRATHLPRRGGKHHVDLLWTAQDGGPAFHATESEHSAVSCRPRRAQAEGIHRSQQADLLAFVAAPRRRLPVHRLLNTARSTRTGEVLHPVLEAPVPRRAIRALRHR